MIAAFLTRLHNLFQRLDSLSLHLLPSLLTNSFFFFCFLRLTPKGIQQSSVKILSDSAQAINVNGTVFTTEKAAVPRCQEETLT